ncbi:hypothetical protein Syun_002788 [Stephania yunnanensis]|uniref:Uncharacterized protein n=1 Tax=Stephania yunnanensis TaxID=152371 RepID=A0AAP0Q8D5_9MAGN
MHLALLLIYVQIGCSLVGSLGALFNGVSLINLVIALFALVAIESSSQSLGRAYALLLCCGILLDIFWFILFSRQIWNTSSSHDYNPLFIFSLRLLFCMQIAGFSVRTASSFLWIQMYRLGLSNLQNTTSPPSDLRSSFLNPPVPTLPRQNSHSDEILGGSIYDPTYYSSLFEGPLDNKLVRQAYVHVVALKLKITHFRKLWVSDGLNNQCNSSKRACACEAEAGRGVFGLASALLAKLVRWRFLECEPSSCPRCCARSSELAFVAAEVISHEIGVLGEVDRLRASLRVSLALSMASFGRSPRLRSPASNPNPDPFFLSSLFPPSPDQRCYCD